MAGEGVGPKNAKETSVKKTKSVGGVPYLMDLNGCCGDELWSW